LLGLGETLNGNTSAAYLAAVEAIANFSACDTAFYSLRNADKGSSPAARWAGNILMRRHGRAPGGVAPR